MEEYRKGIGAIVLDKNNKIIAFQRVSDMCWQGVEGGCDNNEKPIESLYRELKEEIGVNKDQYSIVKECDEFIKYDFPNGKIPTRDGKLIKGQQKKFYLIKLKEDINFDFISFNPDRVEFKSSKIIKAEELVELVPNFKKNMYKKVLCAFELLEKISNQNEMQKY